MPNEQRLAEIRERCDKATSGPWRPMRRAWLAWEVCSAVTAICEYAREDNAVFIAHSREDLPFLLDEIDRLRVAERKYHRLLLAQLPKLYSKGTGAETVYFSNGLRTSVEILTELEAAGLFEQIGDGPEDHIYGKLTEEGWRIIGGIK